MEGIFRELYAEPLLDRQISRVYRVVQRVARLLLHIHVPIAPVFLRRQEPEPVAVIAPCGYVLPELCFRRRLNAFRCRIDIVLFRFDLRFPAAARQHRADKQCETNPFAHGDCPPNVVFGIVHIVPCFPPYGKAFCKFAARISTIFPPSANNFTISLPHAVAYRKNLWYNVENWGSTHPAVTGASLHSLPVCRRRRGRKRATL